MILTKETQEAWVNAYVKEKHTTDECIGFIDGVNKAVRYLAEALTPKPDQEQILLKVQQVWPKGVPFPSFIFESGTWYADGFSDKAGNGLTALEALYFHVNLMPASDTQLGLDSERWNPVLEILVQHVADPIIAEYLEPLTKEEL